MELQTVKFICILIIEQFENLKFLNNVEMTKYFSQIILYIGTGK